MNKINYDKYVGMRMDLEKVEDTKFSNNHPNGFNEGFKAKDTFINLKLSKKFNCLFVNYGDGKWFHTSEVQKQEEHEGYDLIYTLNSVYKVTPIFSAIPGAQEKYSI